MAKFIIIRSGFVDFIFSYGFGVKLGQRSSLDHGTEAVIIYFFRMCHGTKHRYPKIGVIMKVILLLGFTLTCIMSISCTPITKISGYTPLDEEIKELQVGISTKEDVIQSLGEPLTTNDGTTNSLFYVQQKIETIAFLRPKVSERLIINFTFDESKILSKITYLDGVPNTRFIADKEIILTEGRKLTFWQQMFGNIGNFSSEQFLD